MVAFNKFDTFVADVANKAHNLGADTLKIMLTDVAPIRGNQYRPNIAEIAVGNGYVAGGNAVAIASSAQVGGVYKLIASVNTAFVAAGGAFAQFRYAVLYNDTASNKNLIGWWDFGSEINLPDGNTFTVSYDPSLGILELT
jgi:hypothetical protein